MLRIIEVADTIFITINKNKNVQPEVQLYIIKFSGSLLHRALHKNGRSVKLSPRAPTRGIRFAGAQRDKNTFLRDALVSCQLDTVV